MLDAGPLFICGPMCRAFSVSSTWPRGNSGLCDELRRLKLDPHVVTPNFCDVSQRIEDRDMTKALVAKIMKYQKELPK